MDGGWQVASLQRGPDELLELRVARVEGRAAREQHEGEHAQAPHVHGEGVLRAHDLVQVRARVRARATARATARASLGEG